MNEVMIKIKKLRDSAVILEYATDYSAGADIFADVEDTVEVAPGQTAFISAGFAIEIPEGFAGFVFARSGLASKSGLAPANKVGVIDSDYRGEVTVALYNHSNEIQKINPGQRIAQLVIMPYYKAVFEITDELNETERGSGGFGSTGG